MTELVLLCSLGLLLLLLQLGLLIRLQQLEQGLASFDSKLQLDPDLASMISARVSQQISGSDPSLGRQATQESIQEATLLRCKRR